MRCYFTRGNRIEGVTFLKTAPDEELIRQARTLFLAREKTDQFDGFEVWEGTRFIYRENGTKDLGKNQGLDRKQQDPAGRDSTGQ